MPGLEQLVQWRVLPATLFFAIVGIGYFFAVLIIPAVIGGIFHFWSIIDVARFMAYGTHLDYSCNRVREEFIQSISV